MFLQVDRTSGIRPDCQKIQKQLYLFGCILMSAITTSLSTFAENGSRIGPRLEIDNPTIDLGSVAFGQPIEYTFEYENTGDSPLTLDVVEKSCSCGSESHTNGEILPGGTGFLVIEYLPASTSLDTREIEISVIARTNEPREIRFSLSAIRQNAVTVVPEQIIFVREATHQFRTGELIIDCLKEGEFYPRIVNISTTLGRVDALLNSEESLPRLKRYSFSLYFEETIPETVDNGTLRVETTSPSVKYLEVPFIISREFKIRCTPSILALTIESGVDKAIAQVRIHADGEFASETIIPKTDSSNVSVSLKGHSDFKEWQLEVIVFREKLVSKSKSSIWFEDGIGNVVGKLPLLLYVD